MDFSLVRSAPRYCALHLDTCARRHLLVIQAQALDEVRIDLFRTMAPAHLMVLGRPEGELPPGCEVSASPAELSNRLRARLAEACVGIRLYLCGDESFLWRFQPMARELGLEDDEIILVRTEGSRQVYCVHCSNLNQAGCESTLKCDVCGVRLQMREHFSRRLGAFMGVSADVDAPYGEVDRP